MTNQCHYHVSDGFKNTNSGIFNNFCNLIQQCLEPVSCPKKILFKPVRAACYHGYCFLKYFSECANLEQILEMLGSPKKQHVVHQLILAPRWLCQLRQAHYSSMIIHPNDFKEYIANLPTEPIGLFLIKLFTITALDNTRGPVYQ